MVMKMILNFSRKYSPLKMSLPDTQGPATHLPPLRAYTFVASYSSVIFLGLVPVLAEIDESLSLDPDDIERRITERTKAIMPVHMLGNPCNMDRIIAIARKHNLLVLEDCCQAAGASYKGKKVGTIGNIGAFSLNFFKTINSGDGGFVITNDKTLYEKAFGMHDQGHTPNRTGVEVGNRSLLGLNFRINELTAAVEQKDSDSEH
jgi:dTDP-4-amino-4,6-dideoxygalactose transaminase